MTQIPPDELKAEVQRIINSGVLGRSRTYADILNYLADCAIEGQNPKEMAIAVDVLGREADFDVAKDSIVRVHIYHLRNKLQTYYETHGKNEAYRLDIPKGQYTLVAMPADEQPSSVSVTGKPLNRKSWTPWLATVAIVLLLVNLWFEFGVARQGETVGEPSAFANLGLWGTMFDDETPILILVGDYYIFGETDGHGNVMRMVREFDVNSEEELSFMKGVGIEGSSNYINLDMNYIPTSTAFALTNVMKVLTNEVSASRIRVKMVSDHSTADLANNHIIYLGFLSGLGNLHNLMFASSGLHVGGTFDELYEEDGTSYISTSGLSVGQSRYQDYAMISTLPTPTGNQVTMIAGMRDESLISAAEQVSSVSALTALEESLDLPGGEEPAYEALYVVTGFDSTNFASRLVYSHVLEPEAIHRFFGN